MIEERNLSHRLTQEDIQRVFELLEMADEDQRLEVLKRLSPFLKETNNVPIRIKGDNVTTPYSNNNA